MECGGEGGGGEGEGGGGEGGGGVAGVAQMVKPESPTESSLCHCSASPGLIATFAGPFVPEYCVAPIVT